jgi:predicted ribosomally synthesized peptide with SipW-like signal peptide
MKYLIFLLSFLPAITLAAFNDYSNINSFLLNSDINNKKVYVLLNDKRLF